MVILVLALIVFGPKKLPEMGKTIGKGLKEFRKAQADIKAEIRGGMNETPTAEATSSSTAPGAEAPSPPVTDGQGTPASDGHGAAEKSTA
ncbi:MAG: twin-arginine translocase TatA/TatE family subunit [Actinomycetota bacterium]